MTERMIENRVKKLQAIEARMKEPEAQAEELKARRLPSFSEGLTLQTKEGTANLC